MLPTTTTPIPARPAFVYDAAGNRTGRTNVDGSIPSSYTYDYDITNEGLNQLGSRTSGSLVTSYLHGANGNRIEKEDNVSGSVMATWEYDWNQDDRLVEMRRKNGVGTILKTVRYEYCRTCGGQRTGRVEYDEYDEIVEWLRDEMDGLNHLRIDEVFDADSNGELEDPAATGDAWRVQRVYVNGPGQLGQIAKVIVLTYASPTTNTVTSQDVYYYHYDILGNVSVISDSAGAEADQFEQDAFGNLVSGSWSTRIGGITEQITTKPYDADLGLYYFNARWYDSVVGAFVSRDPAIPGSVYAIADQAVTNSVDPSGLCPFTSYAPHGRNPLSSGSFNSTSSNNRVHDPLPPPLDLLLVQLECALALPASATSGICSIYGPEDSFLGYDAQCVCENAGESEWDQKVRGCLACLHGRVEPSTAHKWCYAVADDEFGLWAGFRAKADIGCRLTHKCNPGFRIAIRALVGGPHCGMWGCY